MDFRPILTSLLVVGVFGVPPGLALADGGRDLNYLTQYVLASSVPRVRAECAVEIGQLGPAGKSASRALCRALLDPVKPVQDAAADALEKVNPTLFWPVRTLLANDYSTHARAAAALAKMGREASPAAPILIAHLRDGLASYQILMIRERLTELAGEQRKEQAAIREHDELDALLRKLLAQASNRLQAEADAEDVDVLRTRRRELLEAIPADMQALATIAGDEVPTIKAIGLAFQSSEPGFALASIRAFEMISQACPRRRGLIVSELLLAVRSSSTDVRLAAIQALAHLEDYAASALPTLRKVQARDKSADVRRAAYELIRLLEED